MLWQLKKLSTGETLNEPQKLPENWGPIFGLSGVKDRLGDLSWVGPAYADQGWFVVDDEVVVQMSAEEADKTIAEILKQTAWAVAVDNTSMTKDQRAKWLEFRQKLKDVPLQPGFPTEIVWPTEPQ